MLLTALVSTALTMSAQKASVNLNGTIRTFFRFAALY